MLILDWLYLSFHWSECDQNFREDPSKILDHIPNKINMPTPSQEPPAPSNAPNKDLKDMDVHCIFKIKTECQNLDHGHIKDQWSHPNQNQHAKLQSGTSSALQSPKWGLTGHGCFLHLQSQDRKQKFGSLVYERPDTISRSRSRCQTPVRNLQHLPKPQMRT